MATSSVDNSSGGSYQLTEELDEGMDSPCPSPLNQLPRPGEATELEDISGPESERQPISDDELSRLLHQRMQLEAQYEDNSYSPTSSTSRAAAMQQQAKQSSSSSHQQRTHSSFAKGLQAAFGGKSSSNVCGQDASGQSVECAKPFYEQQTAFSGVVRERQTPQSSEQQVSGTGTGEQRRTDSSNKKHKSRFKQMLEHQQQQGGEVV